MTKNKLAVLLVVIIVLALAVLFNTTRSTQPAESDSTIFSGINGEKVATIELQKAESKIVLSVDDGKWVLPEKGGYPANVGKIRSVLLKLMGLRSSQVLSPTKEGLKKLALDEQGVESGYSKITLLDAEKKQLGGLYLGKQRILEQGTRAGLPTGGSGGQYVRRMNSEQAYLISSPLIISVAADEWIETNIMNVLTKNIYKVEQFDNGKLAFVLTRKGPISSYPDTSLTLEKELPQSQELHSSMLSQVGSGLENVRFSDVFPVKDMSEVVFDKTTKYYLTSGLVYSVHSSKSEDDSLYAKFEVAYDPALVSELKKLQEEQASKKEDSSADQSQPEPPVDENAKEGSSSSSLAPKSLSLEFSSAEDAERLQKKYSQWIYQFAGFQGSKFRKEESDLIKEKDTSTGQE